MAILTRDQASPRRTKSYGGRPPSFSWRSFGFIASRSRLEFSIATALLEPFYRAHNRVIEDVAILRE